MVAPEMSGRKRHRPTVSTLICSWVKSPGPVSIFSSSRPTHLVLRRWRPASLDELHRRRPAPSSSTGRARPSTSIDRARPSASTVVARSEREGLTLIKQSMGRIPRSPKADLKKVSKVKVLSKVKLLSKIMVLSKLKLLFKLVQVEVSLPVQSPIIRTRESILQDNLISQLAMLLGDG
ncbi:uncharacterized protein [Zea mays]|uniref:uncharacterized protein n=1 Tax=Zea mays TaxID=4577 RepID=UPI0016529284|nr:uncharacterized protein LOC103651587 [Zea mays]